jgi:hypothetical protein
MKWDILLMIPIDYIFLIIGGSLNSIYRLPRMLRYILYFSAVSFITLSCSVVRVNDLIDSRLGPVLADNSLKAFRLTLWFTFTLHWIGCWYFSFTKTDGFGGPFLPGVYARSIQYLHSLLVAMKVIAWKGPSKFPQTTRHLMFMNICVLAGLFISAYM